MPDPSIDFLRGTLDLMILKTLSWAPAHGYGIARWIEDCTDDALQVEEGSLYPALHRLEERGLIAAEWGTTENNRRAKFYCLTAKGRKQLEIETSKWDRLAHAIGRILRPLNGQDALTAADNEVVAQAKVRAVCKLYDLYRETSQKQFYEGTLNDRTGPIETSNNKSLELGPEPDNGLAPKENEWGFLKTPW